MLQSYVIQNVSKNLLKMPALQRLRYIDISIHLQWVANFDVIGQNIMSCVKIKNIIVSICFLFLFSNLVLANSYDSIEYNLSVANTHNKPVLAVETIIKG